MSVNSIDQKSGVNIIRTALGIGGVVAVVLGILMLVAPVKTAAVIAAIIAVYAIIAGLVYAGIGIFGRQIGVWPRIGHIVLGVIFVVAGVFAIMDLSNVTAFLAIFVTIFIGVSWIVEGIMALSLIRYSSSKGWTIFASIVGILAGVAILLAPLWALAFLWIFLGIALIVLGLLQVVRAFTFGRAPAGGMRPTGGAAMA